MRVCRPSLNANFPPDFACGSLIVYDASNLTVGRNTSTSGLIFDMCRLSRLSLHHEYLRFEEWLKIHSGGHPVQPVCTVLEARYQLEGACC